jgi:hypothetical protein
MLSPEDVHYLANMRVIAGVLMKGRVPLDTLPPAMALAAIIGGAVDSAMNVMTRHATYDVIQGCADELASAIVDQSVGRMKAKGMTK